MRWGSASAVDRYTWFCDAAAGECDVEQLAGDVLGADDVAAVPGGEPLGAVDGGGVAEGDVFGNVVGGQGQTTVGADVAAPAASRPCRP